MKRRNFLKFVAVIPIVGLINPTKGYPITIGNVPRGWAKPIYVSQYDWNLGDLVEINGIIYTVIEIDDLNHLFLDRPFETFFPSGSRIKVVGYFKTNIIFIV